jgi:hypothetical protein
MAKSKAESDLEDRTSPSHKFGQIIGYVLEMASEIFLQEFADQHGLYLDKKGARGIRGNKVEVRWSDLKDNSHKLDFVLERGGSDTVQGTPVAFIESAWRKLVKHAKNKAQEIEAALFHLAVRYQDYHPFRGAILAGDFSQNSLSQIASGGFNILVFTKEEIMDVLSKFGVNGRYDDRTSVAEIQERVDQFEAVPNKALIGAELVRIHRARIDAYLAELQTVVSRQIVEIHILPLHGGVSISTSVADAVAFIQQHDATHPEATFVRYEVLLRYNNGDEINGKYTSKAGVLEFLDKFRTA